MIIVSLAALVLIAFNVVLDRYQIKKGMWINHTLETIMWVNGWAAFSVLYFKLDIKALVCFITFWPVRWVVFDAALNITRGLPVDYLGSSAHASVLDTFLLKYKLQYPIKLVTLAIVICIDLLILNK